MSDPIQTSCCGQSYCRDCITQVKNKVCPHCRESLEVFPDKKSLRLINDLNIKCPYHIEDKCKWNGSISDLKNHLKLCNIKPIPCTLGCGKQFEKINEEIHAKCFCSLRKIPCAYCQKEVMDKDMAKHHDVCPKMPLPCPNKCGIKMKIARDEMKEHTKHCPEQLMMCKYSEFGCDRDVIRRKNYDEHLSSAMEKHLHLVAEYAKVERNARKLLEEKIASLEKKLNEFIK